jgi:lipopolysaccharide transport system ATP-binding protein
MFGKNPRCKQGGKTVLFVSHNMPVVEGLCERATLIDDGKLKMAGDSHEVIAEYLRMLSLYEGSNLDEPPIKRGGNGRARFSWIEIFDEKDEPMDSIPERRPFKISLRLKVNSSVDLEGIGVTFIDKMGRSVLTTMHSDSLNVTRLDRGHHRFSVLIDPNPFIRGSFSLKLYCRGPNFQEYDIIDYAYNVNITPNLDSPEVLGKRAGAVKIPFEWSSEKWES